EPRPSSQIGRSFLSAVATCTGTTRPSPPAPPLAPAAPLPAGAPDICAGLLPVRNFMYHTTPPITASATTIRSTIERARGGGAGSTTPLTACAWPGLSKGASIRPDLG